MADTDMTTAEREAFLADLHVGILSVARDGKGPLSLPVWYLYDEGEVTIHTSDRSAKVLLLQRRGRASLTVQTETPPYQYVMVEGPVTILKDDRDVLSMASRYLGPELGVRYAEQNPPTDDSVTVHLRPESWLTCDYGKEIS
jgi:PPOX class probable F420-dependent enzyme